MFYRSFLQVYTVPNRLPRGGVLHGGRQHAARGPQHRVQPPLPAGQNPVTSPAH